MSAILTLIEFVLAVTLIPVVMAVTITFAEAIRNLNGLLDYFMRGVLAYTLIHLFLQPMQTFYRFTQNIFSEMLRVSSFLAAHIPRFVPIVPMLLLLILYVLKSFGQPGMLTDYIIFAVGFFLALHLVQTAKVLYEDDSSGFKAQYLLVMALVYIVVAALTVLLLNLVFPGVVFMDFLKDTVGKAADIYRGIGGVLTSPMGS